MLDILKFVLGDMWRFIGTVILMGVLFDGLVALIVAIRGADSATVAGRARRRVMGGPQA
ncbi:hypothetical protein [Phenylobacterium sp.]|uniref:hypothetical protein n=1 Tax=Phenylobacterium sp. TaxID=1871053 RepID=UPI002DE843B2|nr:hypothetical protein [Phenylobacterium sp.]